MQYRLIRLVAVLLLALAAGFAASILTVHNIGQNEFADARVLSAARAVLKEPGLATLVAKNKLVHAKIETPEARRFFEVVGSVLDRAEDFGGDYESPFANHFTLAGANGKEVRFWLNPECLVIRQNRTELAFAYVQGEGPALAEAFEKWRRTSAERE
jgi:hypothetical protein